MTGRATSLIERSGRAARSAATAFVLGAALFTSPARASDEASALEGPTWLAPLREDLLRALEAISSIPRPAAAPAAEGAAPASVGPVAPTTSAAAPAGGGEPADVRHRTREEREAKEVLVGARIILSVPYTREEGREETFAGGALFVERSVVPGVLEVELSAGYAAAVNGESSYVAPFDLLLKHPFHVSEVVNPYVGLGVTMHIERYDGRREVLFGIPVVVGSYFWWNRHLGLDVEVGYKLLFHGQVTHELELGIGPVIHF